MSLMQKSVTLELATQFARKDAEIARLRGLLERAAHLCGQLGDRSYVATVDIPAARALKAEIEEALK